MCQNSASGLQSAQIQKFVDNGMPPKIVKSVRHTMKKRAAEQNVCLDAHTDSDESVVVDPLENITNIGGEVRGNEPVEVYVDVLAISTQITKKFFERLASAAKKLQNTTFYTMLTRTTQPAHAVAVSVLAFVLFIVWPNIFDQKSAATEGPKATSSDSMIGHKLAVLAYLGAFATHFGAQIWMTFVSGLSLYFSLPRHIFGQCQQILFPKYFAMNAMLSFGMLILFVKYFLGNWSLDIWVQLVTLAITAVIELFVRLYLAPPMLTLMLEKYRIEDSVGSGNEVGMLVQGDLVQCPHYQRIHKSFRRIHMTIAMGNMTVLLATCLHLYFLASKIQLVS